MVVQHSVTNTKLANGEVVHVNGKINLSSTAHMIQTTSMSPYHGLNEMVSYIRRFQAFTLNIRDPLQHCANHRISPGQLDT